jgi:hypothetical protein
MAFPGLWEGLSPGGTVLWTFTIVTTNANAMMAELRQNAAGPRTGGIGGFVEMVRPAADDVLKATGR